MECSIARSVIAHHGSAGETRHGLVARNGHTVSYRHGAVSADIGRTASASLVIVASALISAAAAAGTSAVVAAASAAAIPIVGCADAEGSGILSASSIILGSAPAAGRCTAHKAAAVTAVTIASGTAASAGNHDPAAQAGIIVPGSADQPDIRGTASGSGSRRGEPASVKTVGVDAAQNFIGSPVAHIYINLLASGEPDFAPDISAFAAAVWPFTVVSALGAPKLYLIPSIHGSRKHLGASGIAVVALVVQGVERYRARALAVVQNADAGAVPPPSKDRIYRV